MKVTPTLIGIGCIVVSILVAIGVGIYFAIQGAKEAPVAASPDYIVFDGIDNKGFDYRSDDFRATKFSQLINLTPKEITARALKASLDIPEVTNILTTATKIYPKDGHGTEFADLSNTSHAPTKLYVKASNTEMIAAVKAAGNEPSGEYYVS